MGQLDGKVALITGAARGQGRSHALHLAREGADIIAIDICGGLEGVSTPPATPADLEETRAGVEALDRRVVAAKADIRDVKELREAVNAGVSELGGLDIVCANAGVFALNRERRPKDARLRAAIWNSTIDTNLTGTWHTLECTVPILIEQGRGGSIVVTSSTAGLRAYTYRDTAITAYVASKHALTGLVRGYAKDLAEYGIRVNAIHPTGVHTLGIDNDVVGARVEEDPGLLEVVTNALPVDAIDVEDVSRGLLYLVGESGRYITGTGLVIDAGFTLVANG